MKDLTIPESLLPKGVTSPAAFIANKQSDLPDYGIATGDLVIVDTAAAFENDELSAFVNKKGKYRLSKESVDGHKHFGKVVMVLKYYQNSPLSPIDICIDADKKLDSLGLSARSFNALNHANIHTLRQLAGMKPTDLRNIRQVGVAVYGEIVSVMKQNGIDNVAFEALL